MKILTGALRGRTIQFKANPHLRPTAGKVRKAIFDMLQGQLEDKNVLDLFSGTGALGFEALSLGAAYVLFVEEDRAQSKRILENLVQFGMDSKARVWTADALKAISDLSQDLQKFDFVFIDPPYDKDLAKKALEVLAKSNLLASECLLVAECRKSENLPEKIGVLRLLKVKVYGDTKVQVYTL